MMEHVHTVAELRAIVRQWKQAGLRVAVVPTMGNLHAGHLSLVERAHTMADKVIATVFVNPTQFGPNEDFSSYPRTLTADAEKLQGAGVDLLFAPSVDEMYPDGQDDLTVVAVPKVTEELCGAARPGHFDGVTSVVCKLFGQTTPDVACFGEKDYQQLAAIRKMTRDLCLPVEIVGVPTCRETDGLAMSSRNQYLSADERSVAPTLYATLQTTVAALENGERNLDSLQKKAIQTIEEKGFKPDYYEIRDAADLSMPRETTTQFVVLVAAKLGKARLIDNLLSNCV